MLTHVRSNKARLSTTASANDQEFPGHPTDGQKPADAKGRSEAPIFCFRFGPRSQRQSSGASRPRPRSVARSIRIRNSLWRSSRSRILASRPQGLPRSSSTRLTNRAALRNALLRRAASPPIGRPQSRRKKERMLVFRVPGLGTESCDDHPASCALKRRSYRASSCFWGLSLDSAHSPA